MKIPLPTLVCRLLVLGSFGAGAPSLAAAETPTPAPAADLLVIADGVIVGKTHDGQPVRATVQNVVREIEERYPRATINLAGKIGPITVDDMTLRWPNVGEKSDYYASSVKSVLDALSIATGDNIIDLQYGGSDGKGFLLRRRGTPRIADVFNVSGLLYPGLDRLQLEAELRHHEARLAAIQRLSSASAQADGVRVEIEATKALLADASRSPSPEAVDQLVREIKSVVADTLATLRPGEEPPEFSFHPGTNLLVVVGSIEGVEVTRKVLAAIEQPGK